MFDLANIKHQNCIYYACQLVKLLPFQWKEKNEHKKRYIRPITKCQIYDIYMVHIIHDMFMTVIGSNSQASWSRNWSVLINRFMVAPRHL